MRDQNIKTHFLEKLKIFSSVFMLILILYQCELQIVIFQSLEYKFKNEIKQIIKNGIPENELVKFEFPITIYNTSVEGFEWKKKNEFQYFGKMYDIIRAEAGFNSVTFYCIEDIKETELFVNFAQKLKDYTKKYPKEKLDLLNTVHQLSSFYSLSEGPLLKKVYSNEFNFNKPYIFSPLKGYYYQISPPPMNKFRFYSV